MQNLRPGTRDHHLFQLAATKPTTADLATAARVLQWLSDHAHFFPEEYGENAAFKLAQAANACGVAPADLLISTEEFATRDSVNALPQTLDGEDLP